jgi:ribosome-binding protein aMBF1 (putative translation factor)
MPFSMVNTRGREKLREYLEREDALSQTQLAARLSIKQPSVSAWVAGDSRPESHLRVALEYIAGIPAEDWMTIAEADAIERAKASRVGTGTEG